MKKWLLKNQPQEVVGFLPLVQLSLEMVLQLAATRALPTRTLQPSLETTIGTMHIHLTCLVGVRGRAKSQMLWCNAHNVQVGVQMAKLTALQLVQLVGARSTTRGPINQEAGAPPPPSFPHTMLSVKMVKDNMRLAFIEKLFTNRKIGISV